VPEIAITGKQGQGLEFQNLNLDAQKFLEKNFFEMCGMSEMEGRHGVGTFEAFNLTTLRSSSKFLSTQNFEPVHPARTKSGHHKVTLGGPSRDRYKFLKTAKIVSKS